MRPREVRYYQTPRGRLPAKESLASVRDGFVQAILYKRIRQAGLGQFGKVRNIGDGIFEMKIDFGPGYRIYYGIYKDEPILILMVGSKRTQRSDIKKAKMYWVEWKGRN
jgi:putative addiction module killer protein